MKIDESVFWSDSTAVLQYIKNQDNMYRFHTFVANRLKLAVIHNGSKVYIQASGISIPLSLLMLLG